MTTYQPIIVARPPVEAQTLSLKYYFCETFTSICSRGSDRLTKKQTLFPLSRSRTFCFLYSSVTVNWTSVGHSTTSSSTCYRTNSWLIIRLRGTFTSWNSAALHQMKLTDNRSLQDCDCTPSPPSSESGAGWLSGQRICIFQLVLSEIFQSDFVRTNSFKNTLLALILKQNLTTTRHN